MKAFDQIWHHLILQDFENVNEHVSTLNLNEDPLIEPHLDSLMSRNRISYACACMHIILTRHVQIIKHQIKAWFIKSWFNDLDWQLRDCITRLYKSTRNPNLSYIGLIMWMIDVTCAASSKLKPPHSTR